MFFNHLLIEGYKDEGPPILCHPASQQGGEEEVLSLAGGAWSELEVCCGFGWIFGKWEFSLEGSIFNHLFAGDWPACQGTSFQPSWLEKRNFKRKWKFGHPFTHSQSKYRFCLNDNMIGYKFSWYIFIWFKYYKWINYTGLDVAHLLSHLHWRLAEKECGGLGGILELSSSLFWAKTFTFESKLI